MGGFMEHMIWMIIDQKQTQLKIDVEVDPDTGAAQVWKVWDCLENRQIELSNTASPIGAVGFFASGRLRMAPLGQTWVH